MTARSDPDAPAQPTPEGAPAAPAPKQSAAPAPSSDRPASAAFYTPDAATRLMPPLDEEPPEPAPPFDAGAPTTVQEISISFDELPDAPPVVSDPHADPLGDPFGGQATQVDYRSYASDEETGAFEVSIEALDGEPASPPGPRPVSVELPSFDDDEDITDTSLSPPPVFFAGREAPLERPPTGVLLVDASREGPPLPLPRPTPAAPDAPTLQLSALPDDPSSSAEAPAPRAVPRPPTPSRFNVSLPPDAESAAGGPGVDAGGPSLLPARPVELERWRVVPTALTQREGAPEGAAPERPAPQGPGSLPDLSAAQTVLWSLPEEAEEPAAEPPPTPAGRRARTVVWRPDDADEPTGAESGAPISLLEPSTLLASSESTTQAPAPAAARAASTYISDGLAYLRSLHAFADRLDEEERREFMSRALGAAEKLRRALALLSALPVDDESGEEP